MENAINGKRTIENEELKTKEPLNSQLSTVNSQLPSNSQFSILNSPFLSFSFTGFANEAEHLIRTHYRLSLEGGDGAVSASDAGLLEAENFRRKLIKNCKEMSGKDIHNAASPKPSEFHKLP